MRSPIHIFIVPAAIGWWLAQDIMRRWKVQSKVDDAKADAILDAKVNSMVNSENALQFLLCSQLFHNPAN